MDNNTKESVVKADEWRNLLERVRSLILSARRAAARNIDTIQVLTNFRVGQLIVEHEQKGKTRADYGKKILVRLSEHLTFEFGKGFSLSNLKLMRQFYLLKSSQIGRTPSGQLQGGGKSQTLSGQFEK